VRLRRGQIACGLVENENPVGFSFGRTDFEHKLKVTNCRLRPAIIFTESLILAQDERWRRA
jgi:hypothetical protein